MSEIRAKYDEEFKKNAVSLKLCQSEKRKANIRGFFLGGGKQKLKWRSSS